MMVSQDIETKKLLFIQNIRQDKRIQDNQTETLVRQTLEDLMDYTAIASKLEQQHNQNILKQEKAKLHSIIEQTFQSTTSKFTHQLLHQLIQSIENKNTSPKNNILFEDFASIAYIVGAKPDKRRFLGKLCTTYKPLQSEIHRREEGLEALHYESKILYYNFPRKEKKIIQEALKYHNAKQKENNLEKVTSLSQHYASRSSTLLSLSSMRVHVARELYYNENQQRELQKKDILSLPRITFLSKLLHQKAYSNHLQQRQLDYIISRISPQATTKVPVTPQEKPYILFLERQ